MFDATKVRKTYEKRIRNLHFFLTQTLQTFAHFPLRRNNQLIVYSATYTYFLSLMMLTDSAPAISRIPATIIISL